MNPLERKYRDYSAWAHERMENMAHRWPNLSCDGLFHSGLFGSPVTNIEAARDSAGRWHRRPTMDCHPSFSTISRDQLMGLLWWCYHNRDRGLPILERLRAYAWSHLWIMGSGCGDSRHIMTPQFLGLLSILIRHLGGKRHADAHFPRVWPAGLTGYQAHLQALTMLMLMRCGKDPGNAAMDCLRRHRKRNPNNALFAFVAGDRVRCQEILLHEPWFPSRRLPEKRDRRACNLNERDYGADYKPCPVAVQMHSQGIPGSDDIHMGEDLIFICRLWGF